MHIQCDFRGMNTNMQYDVQHYVKAAGLEISYIYAVSVFQLGLEVLVLGSPCSYPRW